MLTYPGQEQSTMQQQSITVENNGAVAVTACLQLGNGSIALCGGATALLEATFAYAAADECPTVDYTVTAGQGQLLIRQQKEPQRSGHKREQRWVLRFNGHIPLVLHLDGGVLTCTTAGAGLHLERLTMQAGVGILTADLSTSERHVTVLVEGGTVSTTLYLPPTVGAAVGVTAPISTVNAPDFQRNGRIYTHSQTAPGPGGVRAAINGGVATVALRLGAPDHQAATIG